MSQVVKLNDRPPKPGTVDLRQDNRIGALLDEYEYAARRLLDAQKEKAKLTEELSKKMGDAKAALVNGWIVKRVSWIRKQYVVKSSVIERLTVLRKPRLMSENEWEERMRGDRPHTDPDHDAE